MTLQSWLSDVDIMISHIIKEFREFSGHTPNEYINMYHPFSDYFLQKELIQNKTYDQARID